MEPVGYAAVGWQPLGSLPLEWALYPGSPHTRLVVIIGIQDRENHTADVQATVAAADVDGQAGSAGEIGQALVAGHVGCLCGGGS